MIDEQDVVNNGKTDKNLRGRSLPKAVSCSSTLPHFSLEYIMHRGYFPLYRKIEDWGWYKHPTVSRVFIHLLLKANFKESFYMGHKVNKGEVVVGRKAISVSLNLTEQQIRTAIKHLKSTSEITMRNCNKFSIIRINNYEEYAKLTSNLTVEQPRVNQRLTTSNNVKNVNNEKKIDSKPKSALLSDDDFIKNLKENPAYKGIDIDKELGRMDAWLSTRPGRKKTRRFIVNWLNKADRAIPAVNETPGANRKTLSSIKQPEKPDWMKDALKKIEGQ